MNFLILIMTFVVSYSSATSFFQKKTELKQIANKVFSEQEIQNHKQNQSTVEDYRKDINTCDSFFRNFFGQNCVEVMDELTRHHKVSHFVLLDFIHSNYSGKDLVERLEALQTTVTDEQFQETRILLTDLTVELTKCDLEEQALEGNLLSCIAVIELAKEEHFSYSAIASAINSMNTEPKKKNTNSVKKP